MKKIKILTICIISILMVYGGAMAELAHIQRDSNGKVLIMCWTAPPGMWSPEEALRVAMNGAPNGISKNTLINEETIDNERIYTFKSGAKIKLLMVGDKCLSVGYIDPEYTGPEC